MCPPKMTEKAARQPTTKTRKRGHSERRAPMSAALRPAREKMSAHDDEHQCLGLDHASAGGKKKGAETRCAGRGAPKTFGGEARSERDRLP